MSASSSRSLDVSRLARGGALNLVASIVAAVGGFALYVILSRLLGKGAAGAFIEGIAIFNILATIVALGSDSGLVWATSRAIALRQPANLRRLVRVAIAPVSLAGIIAAGVIWVNAEALADLLGGGDHSDEIARYLRVLAPVVPIAAINAALLGATRGFGTMIPTAFILHMGRGLTQPAIVWGLLIIGASAGALALGWATPFIAGVAISGLWLRWLIRRADDPDAGPPEPTMRLARKFWGFTLPRSVAAIFRVGVQWLDVLIVGAVLTPADVAIYAVSTRLLQLGLFVALSVGEVAQPMFGGLLAAGERERAQHVYQTATGWQVAVTWPQYITAALFAAVILKNVFGDGFENGAAVVAILALSTMVGAAAGPVDMMLLMAGKSTWSLWNAGITLGTNTVLNLLLVPKMGITGAAVAWAISRLLANAIPLFLVHRYVGLHPFGRATLTAVAASAAVFGGLGVPMWLLAGDTLWGLVVFLVVAVGAYSIVGWRFRETLELPLAWEALRTRRRSSRTDSSA